MEVLRWGQPDSTDLPGRVSAALDTVNGLTLYAHIDERSSLPVALTRHRHPAGYSAVPAPRVTLYVDGVLSALTGHPWQVFGALWLYPMAVGGAITGVAAAFGTVASMALTLFLVVIGNAAAAGPVSRPLLSGFYSTFTAIVPQGSGVSLLRNVEHFGGNGAQTPLVTLALWGAAGFLLAIASTAARVNYGALYECFAGRHRALLRPRVLSPAD